MKLTIFQNNKTISSMFMSMWHPFMPIFLSLSHLIRLIMCILIHLLQQIYQNKLTHENTIRGKTEPGFTSFFSRAFLPRDIHIQYKRQVDSNQIPKLFDCTLYSSLFVARLSEGVFLDSVVELVELVEPNEYNTGQNEESFQILLFCFWVHPDCENLVK